MNDLRRYSPLIPVGSYFVVEDGIYDLFSTLEGVGCFADGPFDSITEFLKENHDFQPDLSCEWYVVTDHPVGFLNGSAEVLRPRAGLPDNNCSHLVI